MKNLHIPTIGEVITLAAPWTFTVHNEHRNETLVEWMGKLFVGERDYSFPLGVKKTMQDSWYSGKPVKELRVDYELSGDITAKCTLPKGAKLRIDRLYIRKNLKDFDSVTFFLQDAKTVQQKRTKVAVQVKLKAGKAHTTAFHHDPDAYERIEVPYVQTKPARPVRFWAKLDDVNRIKIR